MNSSNSNSNGSPVNYSVNGSRYFIGLAAGVVVFIVTIGICSYYCTRRRQNNSAGGDDHNHPGDIEQGLDEAALQNYPKLLYSEAKLQAKHTTADGSCCSICLADYNSNDVTRLLPHCGHLFHQQCLDPWLMLHPNCPVCRASARPAPQTTTTLENMMPPALQN